MCNDELITENHADGPRHVKAITFLRLVHTGRKVHGRSMTTALSAQSFVRLLKAPTDPPNPESPPKIQIACAAWDDATIHIPNKHELIAEFILTRLLKDKSKARCVALSGVQPLILTTDEPATTQ